MDSSRGFNQWAALSLLSAADQAMVFLYPDEQNKRGVELLLEALTSVIPLQLVFLPVPPGDAGMARVGECWQALQSNVDAAIDQTGSDEDEESQEVVAQSYMAEPIIVPYLTELALASSYPVLPLLSNYIPIANVIDEAIARVSPEMPTTTN